MLQLQAAQVLSNSAPDVRPPLLPPDSPVHIVEWRDNLYVSSQNGAEDTFTAWALGPYLEIQGALATNCVLSMDRDMVIPA